MKSEVMTIDEFNSRVVTLKQQEASGQEGGGTHKVKSLKQRRNLFKYRVFYHDIVDMTTIVIPYHSNK